MPYWVFNNFVAFLNEIIDEENGGKDKNNDGTNSVQEHLNTSQNIFKNQMSNMSKNLGIKNKLKL